MKTVYATLSAYITKDGSEIRELMHPGVHENRNQSLAEATVAVGGETQLHYHRTSEELYHVTQGRGLMRLGDTHLEIGPGDTVHIPPGMPHAVRNTGDVPLRILCACSPAYSHADTELLSSGVATRSAMLGRTRRGAGGEDG